MDPTLILLSVSASILSAGSAIFEGHRRNKRMAAAQFLRRKYDKVIMSGEIGCGNNIYLIHYCENKGGTRVAWPQYIHYTIPEYIPFRYKGYNVEVISRNAYNNKILLL